MGSLSKSLTVSVRTGNLEQFYRCKIQLYSSKNRLKWFWLFGNKNAWLFFTILKFKQQDSCRKTENPCKRLETFCRCLCECHLLRFKGRLKRKVRTFGLLLWKRAVWKKYCFWLQRTFGTFESTIISENPAEL